MSLQPQVLLDEPGTGSPDDRAHYACSHEISRAAVEGGKVTALCGVQFQPVRDPSRFPVCETCKTLNDINNGRCPHGRRDN